MRARVLLVAVLATVPRLRVRRRGARPAAPDKPPVVVLIFDEFPVDTLLRPDGSIDAERYPQLRRPGGHLHVVPERPHDLRLDVQGGAGDPGRGDFRGEGTAADFRSHPPNIYHLFDGLGYGVVDVESGEALCPPRICPGARTRRPGVLARLAGGGRPPRLHALDRSDPQAGRARPSTSSTRCCRTSPGSTCPRGTRAGPRATTRSPAINGPIGFHDQALTNHNETRHLLQVGFVDRQVGLLLDRLRRTGLLDQALIVVTADHGYAFEVGVKDRRLVTERNVDEIAPVPLFVKAPGQTEGEVDESVVRNIDIVPTMADLLDTEARWRHDGRSAFAPVDPAAPRGRSAHARLQQGDPDRPGGAAAAPGAPTARRRAALVRTGEESDLLFGSPWASLYRVGSHPELIGRRVGELPAAPRARAAPPWPTPASSRT